MTTRTKIPKKDAGLLEYAGYMGHDFICIIDGKDGDRRIRAQCSDLQSAIELFESYDKGKTVYQCIGSVRGKKKWKQVYQSSPTQSLC